MARKIFFTPQNISAVLVVGLCFGVNWGTQKAVGVGGGDAPVTATKTADAAPIKPVATDATPLSGMGNMGPFLIADDELGASIQVRATYLLGVGRDNGNAKTWLTERRNDVQWELNELRQAIGSFDGDSEYFGPKTNLESELAATELALHWINHPSDRNELPSIPVNRPIDFYSAEDGPTQGVVDDDQT